MQELGLTVAYSSDDATHQYIQNLLALSLIPATEIKIVFDQLKNQATTVPLQPLTNYIGQQWVELSTFPPEEWSVYEEAIHTNNDIEGWHNALNCQAQGRVHLLLYMWIQLLHQESKFVAIQVRLVSDRKLKRTERRQYRKLQAKVVKQWEKYSDNEKTVLQLLKACSHLNGPVWEH